MTVIDWNEQFKIRIRRNASLKHEVTKLTIVRNLIEKYKRQLQWIKIYTEYPITNSDNKSKICDVYFENIKTKEAIAYEIQNQVSKEWLEETTQFYSKWDKIFLKTDWILIEEKKICKEIDDSLTKLKEEIDNLIV